VNDEAWLDFAAFAVQTVHLSIGFCGGVPGGDAVLDLDLVAEILAEESNHFGSQIFDAGLQMFVKIFGRSARSVGPYLFAWLGEAESVGFGAIDIFDIVAAAPAPRRPRERRSPG
jgi:hypothetical protein